LYQFDGDTPAPEQIPVIAQRHTQLVATTFAAHREEVDHIKTGNGMIEELPLVRVDPDNPDRVTHITMESDGRVHFMFEPAASLPSAHEHYLDPDGALRRGDHDVEFVLLELPELGALPDSKYQALRQRLREEDNAMRQESAVPGLAPDSEVGIAEQRYAQQQIESAKPRATSARDLLAISTERFYSDDPVAPEDAMPAAQGFKQRVSDFVRHHPQNAGKPVPEDVLISTGKLGDSNHMRITVGEDVFGDTSQAIPGSPVPFIGITLNLAANSTLAKAIRVAGDRPVEPTGSRERWTILLSGGAEDSLALAKEPLMV
jgi:hypothetical protein